MINVLIDKAFIEENRSNLLLNDTNNISQRRVLRTNVLEDTQFVLLLTDVHDVDFEFVFNVPGVTSNVIGFYSLHKDERLNVVVKAIHNVENTSCVVDIKGVLFDNSKSVHLGEIFIDKNAFNTNSFLHDHSLLLGKNSRTIAMPNLRIHNNQVKASHGAVIGTVNGDNLYYLQSRGFTKKGATDILVTGFFESTFADINDQNMANTLRHKLLT